MGAKSRKGMCELGIVGDGQTGSYKLKSYLHKYLLTMQVWLGSPKDQIAKENHRTLKSQYPSTLCSLDTKQCIKEQREEGTGGEELSKTHMKNTIQRRE